jgi:DNA polymerase-4
MHVDLDAFFVEVCRRRLPELRGVDRIIVGGRSRRGVVQSASYGARKVGVRSAMPMYEALRRCPDATVVQGRFPWYREASRAVRAVLERHAPVVAMASLDEAYLDFGGTDRLFPVSLLPVAERIRDAVRADTGLDCSIGIGPNRMIAKVASDQAKPRGILEVRAGWEAEFLAGLPLRAIPGIGPRTATAWAEKGLTDVWQVQRMPLAQLVTLVGAQARELQWRAAGNGGTTLRPRDVPRSISRETTLARDARTARPLERLLAILTSRVAAQMRDEGLAARTVTLKLRHGDFHTVTRRRTLPEASDLDAELGRAALELFRGAFGDVGRRGRGVRLIGVAASNFVEGAVPDLFEPAARARERALTEALDEARRRFGAGTMVRAEELPTRHRHGERP